PGHAGRHVRRGRDLGGLAHLADLEHVDAEGLAAAEREQQQLHLVGAGEPGLLVDHAHHAVIVGGGFHRYLPAVAAVGAAGGIGAAAVPPRSPADWICSVLASLVNAASVALFRTTMVMRRLAGASGSALSSGIEAARPWTRTTLASSMPPEISSR